MKRREALKNLGLATGFVVASPSIISLLQSCTAEAKTWTPVFLSVEEGVVLANLVDIILPKTDIPSATEVNVPQFIDKYIHEGTINYYINIISSLYTPFTKQKK